MRLQELNDEDRYKVAGYRGVAFWFAGPEVERYWNNANDEPDWDDWAERGTGMALMVMVDVERIADSEYCSECGQIGCGWGSGDE